MQRTHVLLNIIYIQADLPPTSGEVTDPLLSGTLTDSPDLQHYLKELKKGDIVEVTYTEAIAVSVAPAS